MNMSASSTTSAGKGRPVLPLDISLTNSKGQGSMCLHLTEEGFAVSVSPSAAAHHSITEEDGSPLGSSGRGGIVITGPNGSQHFGSWKGSLSRRGSHQSLQFGARSPGSMSRSPSEAAVPYSRSGSSICLRNPSGIFSKQRFHYDTHEMELESIPRVQSTVQVPRAHGSQHKNGGFAHFAAAFETLRAESVGRDDSAEAQRGPHHTYSIANTGVPNPNDTPEPILVHQPSFGLGQQMLAMELSIDGEDDGGANVGVDITISDETLWLKDDAEDDEGAAAGGGVCGVPQSTTDVSDLAGARMEDDSSNVTTPRQTAHLCNPLAAFTATDPNDSRMPTPQPAMMSQTCGPGDFGIDAHHAVAVGADITANHTSPPQVNAPPPAEAAAPTATTPSVPPPKPKPKLTVGSITIREALVADAEGIVGLREIIDMTGAFALLWPLEEMRQRIADRYPMLVVATTVDLREDSPTKGTEIIIGVAGMDVAGMEEDMHIRSVGSRTVGVPANTDFIFPMDFVMCRGMLIHPAYQGCGIGSKLHKGRLMILAAIKPNPPGVLIGGRAATVFDVTMDFIKPILEAPRPRDCPTPEFSKKDMFVFTYHSAHSIVHMVHPDGNTKKGWTLAGIDYADGGPLWVATKPLLELIADYDVDVTYPEGLEAPITLRNKAKPAEQA